ncbi:MAG: ribosome hibernation-promoting factor, HPF/YfiA family [Chitinophagales bacterium]
MKVQIQAQQFKADQKLVQFIQKKAAKLEQFFDHIIRTEVYLALEGGNGVKNKVVTVKLHIPGNQIAVTQSTKLFEHSTDLAISSLTRQLKKYKAKLRR